MRKPSSASCAGATGVGAPVIGSMPDCGFGKAMTSRTFVLAGEDGDQAVEAEREAAVGRGPVAGTG